jgi:hypothetical protein
MFVHGSLCVCVFVYVFVRMRLCERTCVCA